jgi:hypothetical protein
MSWNIPIILVLGSILMPCPHVFSLPKAQPTHLLVIRPRLFLGNVRSHRSVVGSLVRIRPASFVISGA